MNRRSHRRIGGAAATVLAVVGLGATSAIAGDAPPVGEDNARGFAQQDTRTLRVHLAGTGDGVVTGPGINCPTDCEEAYSAGTHVSLTADPEPGSSFGGFEGGGFEGSFGGDCAGDSCSFAMNGDRTIIATFVSHDFQFQDVRRNTRAGTAKLIVSVPGPGQLSLRGKGIKARPQVGRAAAKPVSEAGLESLSIRAKGEKQRKLRRTGRATVFAKVTYTPTGGTANTETKKVKLQRKR